MPSDDSGIRRLVLASVSPRRRQLLTLLGIPFTARGASTNESQLEGETPTDLVVRVSRAKAYAMRDVRRDELVVAAARRRPRRAILAGPARWRGARLPRLTRSIPAWCLAACHVAHAPTSWPALSDARLHGRRDRSHVATGDPLTRPAPMPSAPWFAPVRRVGRFTVMIPCTSAAGYSPASPCQQTPIGRASHQVWRPLVRPD